jgi:hypothetical protein
MTASESFDELFVIVSWPVAAPLEVGSNCTLRVAGVPGFTVMGNVAPVSENPVPVTVAAVTVTALLPLAVSVTDCVEGLFTTTFPKAMLVALMLSVCWLAAFNCNAKVLETPFAEAVSVTDCAELTAATDAENPALVAFAGTVTEAGTVAEVLLLARFTVNPPAGAAALNVTVQESDPAAVIDPLLQVSAFNTGGMEFVPVPLSETVVVALVEELLDIVIWPLAAPAPVGSNCTFKLAELPGFRVIGNDAPETVKPVPATVALLMVSAVVPVELRISDFWAGAFTTTLPKSRLLALTFSEGFEGEETGAGFSCTVNVCDAPFALAVKLADCALLTAAALAVKPALVAFAVTVTEEGIVTAALLLARPTLKPLDGAAALSVTVHVSVPAPAMELLEQDRPLSDGEADEVPPFKPIPCSVTVAVGTITELLVMVRLPESSEADVGS